MDSLIIKANIFTGEPSAPFAQAVLIQNGKIILVGSADQVAQAAPAGAKVLDLPGRLAVPGLVDGHVHLAAFGKTFLRVDLTNLDSIEACRERIRAYAASRRPGEWIVGWGWNHHAWREQREPTRRDVDDLCPENPLLLYRMCGHSVWVNSLALEQAGINKDTPDPAGGKIERDPETGLPTGLVKECFESLESLVPLPTRDDLKQALLAAQVEALRRGVTGVHSLESLAEWEALSELDREGRLRIRVHHTLPPHELEQLAAGGQKPSQGDRLWLGGLKLFTDGSLGSGTALMHEEYSDEPGQLGVEFSPRETLLRNILLAYGLGCDVAIHAIGDRALANALEVYRAAREQSAPTGDHRDRVEHVQLFRHEDLDSLRDLGLTASVQPVHLATDWSIAQRRWGAERAPRAYAYNSLMKAGLPVMFGSDAPVESIDPLLGLKAAVTRQDLQGRPGGGWQPQERVTLAEALRAFTALPAWVSRKEASLGTVAPGKIADLTIFGRDLFDLAPEEWPGVEIELTMIDGEIAYRKS
ncbi:MAG: amidohydrolase [Pseudomonadota bacterium]